MREKSRDIERLRHIANSIDNVSSFLNGKNIEDMKSDIMCYHAVVYNIMIIGEAANMLTKKFREKHNEVPWRQIVDMRNVLVHGYFTTRYDCSSNFNKWHHILANSKQNVAKINLDRRGFMMHTQACHLA